MENKNKTKKTKKTESFTVAVFPWETGDIKVYTRRELEAMSKKSKNINKYK